MKVVYIPPMNDTICLTCGFSHHAFHDRIGELIDNKVADGSVVGPQHSGGQGLVDIAEPHEYFAKVVNCATLSAERQMNWIHTHL
jgi:hypothetical protein